jgi:hypothetical protein
VFGLFDGRSPSNRPGFEAFDRAAEVLGGARVLVHQRAERAVQDGMTDERSCGRD